MFEDVNIKRLGEVIESQEKIWKEWEAYDDAKRKGVVKTWRPPPKLERFTILIDDLSDSTEFTGFFSGLSALTTKNWHWNIQFIFSGHKWTKISPVIREQSDLIFLGYTKVGQNVFKFLSEGDSWKELRQKYEELIENSKDESYPFMLFVNNPRRRSALKSAFLFK